MRHLPPAGTPIFFDDLLAWIKTIFSTEKTLELFSQVIREHFSKEHVFFLSTGRAAMVVLLTALKEKTIPERNQVIIPSYTCFSVPSSIVKAGLKIRICDVDPTTLDYDYDKLSRIDFSKVICIISANLYGIPNNLPALEAMAEEKGVFLVDDAAQSMGATIAGQKSGTFGTAGIFSLDKGKVITSINGGIIISDSSNLADRIKQKIDKLSSPPAIWKSSEVVKLIIYSLFLDPTRYWIPARLPFLNLGATIYTTEYRVDKYNKLLCGLALQLFDKLDMINKIRVENGHYFREALKNIPGVRLTRNPEFGDPIFLRFPLLVTNPVKRLRILNELAQQGLGGSASFPASIADIVELHTELLNQAENAYGGRTVAEQIVTLPTHPFVNNDDRAAIVKIVKQNK